MKKLLSALLILVTVFTLFGCKAAPEEEVALPLDTATDTQSEAENQTEDKETEQQESKPQTEDKTEEKEEEPKETNQQTEQTEQPMGEKAPPSKATIEDNFRENEIHVIIIKELSRTRETFTAEDFPGIDVEKVYVNYGYYEDSDNRVILKLTIKNGTKQKVLDSIKVLEQNPIVYYACPNFILEIAEQVEIKKEETEEKTEEQIEYPIGEKGPPCKATIDMNFSSNRIHVDITKEVSRIKDTFTAKDFPGIDVSRVQIISEYNKDTDSKVRLKITLKTGTKQKVLDSIKVLEQNPLVYTAEPVYF